MSDLVGVVDDLDQIVVALRRQSCRCVFPSDLSPKYLGVDGYVGVEVERVDGGPARRIWIRPPSDYDESIRPATSEWLTHLLARNHELPVTAVIAEYLNTGINWFGRYPVERVGVLALAAHLMEFIEDPLDGWLRMPFDHPLANGELEPVEFPEPPPPASHHQQSVPLPALNLPTPRYRQIWYHG